MQQALKDEIENDWLNGGCSGFSSYFFCSLPGVSSISWPSWNLIFMREVNFILSLSPGFWI